MDEFLSIMRANFTFVEELRLVDIAANGTTAPYDQDLET